MDNKLITLWTSIIDQAANNYKSQDKIISLQQYSSPVRIYNNILYVAIDNIDLYNWLNDISTIKLNEIATNLYKNNLEIQFILEDKKLEILNLNENGNVFNSKLDKDLTFDTYIVGRYNKKPYSILEDFLINNQVRFNPIFIYGSTGVGKTHLVNAFAFAYINKYPDKKIKFINAEDFSRDIYDIVSSSEKLEAFKKNNAKYDVFIMEDIQFLADKTKSNEIFFTIFNNLINDKHLIIITSDRAPDSLNGFTDRMISRYGSGVILDFEQPDTDTLKNIAVEKLKQCNIKLTNDAVELITRYFFQDIRKLIGGINTLLFNYGFNYDNRQKVINDDELKKLLGLDEESIKRRKMGLTINPESIMSTIAKLYSIKVIDLTSPTRKSKIVNARCMCMYILRSKMGLSFENIGALFGNRSHSTVMTAVSKFEEQLKKDSELRKTVEDIIKKL